MQQSLNKTIKILTKFYPNSKHTVKSKLFNFSVDLKFQ